MASARPESRNSDDHLPDGIIMTGILAMLVADRDERVDGSQPRRSELVLGDAGLEAREIAALTGKNYEAVRSLLRRAKGKTT